MKKNKSYYFETPEIEGVIIKRENGTYCIKAMVKYTNADNLNLWFAKIRIGQVSLMIDILDILKRKG